MNDQEKNIKREDTKMENKKSFTPGPLTFDGFGINGGDEFKSQIATFGRRGTFDAEIYGPLFAAAPELLAALKKAYVELLNQGVDEQHADMVEIAAVISKAEGNI